MVRRGGEDGSSSNSIDALATSFKNQMDDLQAISPECCIYRVPPTDRVLKAEVYAPRAVSIGPFHHNKKELQGMKEHKLRYMKVFLIRANKDLDDLIFEMMKWENKARNSYFEKIDLSVEEFMKILIKDSFFILETMIGVQNIKPPDRVFYLPNHSTDFKTDLFLLENQIPFFFLKKLFELAPVGDPPMQFLKVCVDYIALSIIPIRESTQMLTKVQMYVDLHHHEIKHFVDLLRIFHLPSNLGRVPKNVNKLITIPNAVQLQEAGVQLLKVSSSNSLLDIEFTNGELKIPVLIVHKYFKLIMSNIFVLEKYHYPYESYIGHYASFMQMLVDTDKDADLLIQNGIIEDWVGQNSIVADLFSKVGDEVWNHIPSYYLYDISERLNEYCNVARHKWMASFKRDYCSSPWMIVSTIAAIMLLIFTFLSAIAAFLAL
ncbi:hypothetical protein LguiB_027612 [Lonicera macranthoides]